jgi:hypothetical protein
MACLKHAERQFAHPIDAPGLDADRNLASAGNEHRQWGLKCCHPDGADPSSKLGSECHFGEDWTRTT